jgi:hypothetical protein
MPASFLPLTLERENLSHGRNVAIYRSFTPTLRFLVFGFALLRFREGLLVDRRPSSIGDGLGECSGHGPGQYLRLLARVAARLDAKVGADQRPTIVPKRPLRSAITCVGSVNAPLTTRGNAIRKPMSAASIPNDTTKRFPKWSGPPSRFTGVLDAK